MFKYLVMFLLFCTTAYADVSISVSTEYNTGAVKYRPEGTANWLPAEQYPQWPRTFYVTTTETFDLWIANDGDYASTQDFRWLTGYGYTDGNLAIYAPVSAGDYKAALMYYEAGDVAFSNTVFLYPVDALAQVPEPVALMLLLLCGLTLLLRRRYELRFRKMHRPSAQGN